MRLIGMVTRFVAVVCIVATLAACEHVDEITPKKFAGLLVAHAAPLKIDISKSLRANPGGRVPQAGALELSPPPGASALGLDFGWVTSGGAIFVQSNKYGVTLIQEPVVVDGAIKWTCVVSPASSRPDLCGSDYENSMLGVR